MRNVPCLFIALILTTSPAMAQLDSLISYVGGSALLNEAGDRYSDAVRKTQAMASALIQEMNIAGRDRLAQIDGILNTTVDRLIDETEEGAIRVLNEATAELLSLKDEIFLDVSETIWEAECAGRRWTIDDMRQAMGRFGEILGGHQVRVHPLVSTRSRGFCLRNCDRSVVVDIKEPFKSTYDEIKRLMEDSINSNNIDGQTNAYDVVNTWEYMSGLARTASCHYPNNPQRWVLESLEYSQKAKEWHRAVTMEII